MRRFLLALAVLAALGFCAASLAEGEWAELSAAPGTDSDVVPGDGISCSLTLSESVPGECYIRLSMSAGLSLDENTLAVTQNGETSSPVCAWGNDGCVIILTDATAGDEIRFTVTVDGDASGALTINATMNDATLSLDYVYIPPTPAPVATAAPTEEPVIEVEETTSGVYVPKALLFLAIGVIVLGLATWCLVMRLNKLKK